MASTHTRQKRRITTWASCWACPSSNTGRRQRSNLLLLLLHHLHISPVGITSVGVSVGRGLYSQDGRHIFNHLPIFIGDRNPHFQCLSGRALVGTLYRRTIREIAAYG